MDSAQILEISKALFDEEDEDVDTALVDDLAGTVYGSEEDENHGERKQTDLEGQLMNDLLVPRTQKQYNVQLRKFSEYCGHQWEHSVDIPKIFFTDYNIAGFLHELAVKSEYVPHAKKAAVASLNHMVKKYALPALNSVDHHIHWPLVYKSLEVKKVIFCPTLF